MSTTRRSRALLRAPHALPVGVGLAALLVAGSGSWVAASGDPVPLRATSAAAAVPLDAGPDLSAALPEVPAAAPAPASPPPAAPAPAPAAPDAPTAPPVAPLQELRAPDLLVRVPVGTPTEALEGLRGVEAVARVDLTTVAVGGAPAVLAGVDPAEFRAFTPAPSASSDALWQVVARGEVVGTHGLQQTRGLALGADLPDLGRLGGVAALGLPEVDLVADRATAAAAGQVAPAVLVAAPDRSTFALLRDVRRALGEVEVEVLRPAPVQAAPVGRPGSYRALYQASARLCPGLSWTVLAAVGQVESGHGRHLGPSSAGALGPMQFLPSTWDAYGVDGDGDGRADIMSAHDAVPAAALYLCRFGGGRDADGLYDALFAYNHADWYVRKVLALAAQYR